jgi:hypothetical protein
MNAALGVRFAAAGVSALFPEAVFKAGLTGVFGAAFGAFAAGFGAALLPGLAAALAAGFAAALVVGFAATLAGAFAAAFLAATGALAAAFETAAIALVVALGEGFAADLAAGVLVDAKSAVDFLVGAIRCSPEGSQLVGV